MKTKLYPDNNFENLPIYINTIGYNLPQPLEIRPNGYYMHQIFIVSNGDGIFEIRGKEYILNKGDMFFIKADIPHRYNGLTKSFSTSYISFDGKGCEDIFKYYSVGEYGVYKEKNIDSVHEKIKNLYESVYSDVPNAVFSSNTYSTVIDFFESAIEEDITLAEKTMKYLMSAYKNDITLDDILRYCKCSKSKLYRDFKDKYNKSIFDMLLQIRLQNARSILQYSPNEKTKDVAKKCGFNSVSYFCKQYKRFYNCSPKGN